MPKGVYKRTKECNLAHCVSSPGSGVYKHKLHTQEHKDNIAKARTGTKATQKTKDKMSVSTLKRKKELGYVNSPEARRKMRLSRISYIEVCYNNGLPIHPTIGKNEKQILDAIEKQDSIKIVRQYRVLGYYLDGYCKETNTAYEVDEKRHFDSDGCLIQRDVERESEIIEHLKCTFIRVTDV